MPKKGGVIVAPNHASYLDPIFVGIGSSRLLNYIARETLFKNFLFGWLIRTTGAFPIKRNFHDLGAIKEAIRRLKNGRPVLIFPEATRTTDGNLQPVKGGISFLAHSAGVPVMPVYIKGSFDVWPKGAKCIRCSKVSVYFGKPIYFKGTSDDYQAFADSIMENIAKLRDESKDS
jgi:1-acyl-sn-glycerol-3-phosphate acyltransferase